MFRNVVGFKVHFLKLKFCCLKLKYIKFIKPLASFSSNVEEIMSIQSKLSHRLFLDVILCNLSSKDFYKFAFFTLFLDQDLNKAQSQCFGT
jgi:hypothetical protein